MEMAPDLVPDASDGAFRVELPSGSTYTVMSKDERDYVEDRSKRYVSEYSFSSISDLQDVDRILMLELMCHRWGEWQSQGIDYDGNDVSIDDLAQQILEVSKELRQVKKLLGIDKVARDKEKGESAADYIENLKRRAKQFGVMREEQLSKSITLFQELKALVVLHDNADEKERHEQKIEVEDIMNWLRETAFPEFDAIDAYFREHNQRFWIHSI